MPELSLQSLWEKLRSAPAAVPPPMSLSALGDDPWSRYNQPFGEVRGTAPEDTPTVFQTRNGVRITEGDIQRGMDVGMGAATVGGPAKGIKAFHSSPHDFDRFDLSKIGTGEGAQMYGHGIYAAENPAVSGQGGQYWQQFQKKFEGPEYLASHKLKSAGFDRDAAAALAQKDIDAIAEALKSGKPPLGLQGGPFDEHVLRSITNNMLYDRQAELDLLRSNRPVGPRTYELNIKADPAQMLDWDKAISTQPHVEEALRRGGFVDAKWPYSGMQGGQSGTSLQPLTSGEDAYRAMGIEKRGRDAPVYDQRKAATDVFGEAGIPGIKYLDEGSRNIPTQRASLENDIAKARASGDQSLLTHYQGYLDRLQQPTSNYVIFDPANIDIMRKYGLAGLAPLAGAGVVAGQQQEPVY